MQGTIQTAPKPLFAVTAGSKASCAATQTDFPGSTPRMPVLHCTITAARALLCPASGTCCAATAMGARPTETHSRKSQGNGRPDIQSIAAVLARGISSAPHSTAQPIVPAGSHSILLLSHACLSALPWRLLGHGATTPISQGLQAAMPAAPTQL